MNRRRQAADRTDGRDIEDLTLAFADHLFVKRLCDGKEAVDVRVDHPVPALVGRRRKIVGLVDRRVVDQNIDRAPRVQDLAGDVLHPEAVGDRTLKARARRPWASIFAFNLLGQIVARMVIECDVGTFAGEDLADRRSDAARAAGNERTFSFK